MENIYWKVHKDNLKYVEEITQNQLNVWTDIIERSRKNYIYVVKNKESMIPFSANTLAYMPYNKISIKYLENGKYKYKGEFFNQKETRLKKLKKLKNETI